MLNVASNAVVVPGNDVGMLGAHLHDFWMVSGTPRAVPVLPRGPETSARTRSELRDLGGGGYGRETKLKVRTSQIWLSFWLNVRVSAHP